MKRNVLFAQFSDELLTSDSCFRDYYRQAYSKMEGYNFPEHFMEIPLWIPKASAMLSDGLYEKEIHIVKDVDESIDHIVNGSYEYVMFSVMSSNEEYVRKAAGRISSEIILGGYTDPRDFDQFQNVNYLNSLEEMGEHLDIVLGNPPDYSLFSGLKCIPRITLSEGCTHECSYCSVPVGLKLISDEEIVKQAQSIEPLDFKLVFVDDKCFGQAGNYDRLMSAGDSIRIFNNDFLGFIAQTSPSIAVREGFIGKLSGLGVRYLELGVETLNDEYLKKFNKPHKSMHVEKTCKGVREVGGIMIIPNLIMGIPGDSYEPTIEWVQRNLDIIPAVNINYLSVHHDSPRGQPLMEPMIPEDYDQNSSRKSWLSERDTKRMEEAVERIHEMTI